MNRLATEHRRLFATGPAGQLPAAAEAPVHALVVALHSPADWPALAPLWRGVQADFDWPEPAIAVNGRDAFELWFALADPMSRADAQRLLAQLQARFLADVRPDRLRAWPAEGDAGPVPACPPFAAGPERWAAFVTPDLPAVFGDDPALDFAPGADAQADLLSRLRPITATPLRRARALLSPADKPAAPASPTVAPAGPDLARAVQSPADPVVPRADGAAGTLPTIGHQDDPRAFLRAVMNDVSAPLALRIEAAKGLLLATAKQA